MKARDVTEVTAKPRNHAGLRSDTTTRKHCEVIIAKNMKTYQLAN